MATIALEGMKFHAFHGVYDPEKVLGTEYVVDVYVETNTAMAADTDDVGCTVNYETIYQIVSLEMEQKRNLLETVAQNIIHEIKRQFGTMSTLRVRVRKLNPPLGGRVESAWVEDESDFMNTCPRCGTPLFCYQDDTCWCKDLQVHPATLEAIRKQYRSCLCRNCLKFYAG